MNTTEARKAFIHIRRAWTLLRKLALREFRFHYDNSTMANGIVSINHDANRCPVCRMGAAMKAGLRAMRRAQSGSPTANDP